MSHACPVNNDVMGERVPRVVALLILPLLALALWTRSPWITLLIAGDFGLRGLGLRRLSPLARLAQAIVSATGGSGAKVNAGPKQFAAKLGFGFSLIIAAAQAAQLVAAAWIVGVALGVCAGLEGLLNLCVGCHIYQLLPGRRRENGPLPPTSVKRSSGGSFGIQA